MATHCPLSGTVSSGMMEMATEINTIYFDCSGETIHLRLFSIPDRAGPAHGFLGSRKTAQEQGGCHGAKAS